MDNIIPKTITVLLNQLAGGFMPFCTKCGNDIEDTDRYCKNCGAEITSHRQTSIASVDELSAKEPEGFSVSEKRSWEINQSRAAVFTAVGIILLIDIISIISYTLTEFDRPGLVVGSIIMDIFLGIFLILGKNWARIWIIFRAALGLVIWGLVSLVDGDYGGLLLNTGVLVAVILLLTGSSTRFRIVGSGFLAAVAFIGGITIVIFQEIIVPSVDLPSAPATYTIPTSFDTYTSEGFFSISYPPDWSPEMSLVEEIEEGVLQFLKDEGMGSEAEDYQIVFIGGNLSYDDDYVSVIVCVESKGIWPLEAMVESNHQWSIENMERYIERSRVKTTIDGNVAIIQTYQGEDVDSYLTGFTSAVIASDNFLWTVICSCDNDQLDSNLDTFEKVVRSLRVEY